MRAAALSEMVQVFKQVLKEAAWLPHRDTGSRTATRKQRHLAGQICGIGLIILPFLRDSG